MEEENELQPPKDQDNKPQDCGDDPEDNVEEIPAELIEIVENEDIDPKIKVRRIQMATLEMHSGPLPHPRMFAQYKKVLESAPERIMEMAEKEQDHRHGIDFNESQIRTKLVDADNNRADRGLLFGFLLVLGLFGTSLTLFLTGRETAGYVTFIINIGGIIANFIRVGRERKDRKDS